MEAQFKYQRAIAEHRSSELFGVMNDTLTQAEKDALTYLYAYMPLQDMADYDGEFFLRAVKATLKARSEMPWGETITDDVFLAFVLPIRVNNENLDEARPELFATLKDRVKGLSMEKAILEVNHWCHEKVTYRGTDGRTSGPLSTIRTSWGRCGEETVLVVAALRAVGIPARQLYTPRWAHVDDNHAWVEAWVDGNWHFLGACEPEPMLDMAWFHEPARRAMMVHTKAYGGFQNDSFKVKSDRYHDELQVLSTYAPASERRVSVVDVANRPVSGALVEFGLYNYAEFFPLSSPLTDSKGQALLPTGKGDLRIWASKDNLTGSAILNADVDEIVIKIAPFNTEERIEFLDINPPIEPMPVIYEVSKEAREANRIRLAREDRIREAYMATFANEASCRALASELELNSAELWDVLYSSQGNHAQIRKFLQTVPAEQLHWAMAMLGVISEKDLRDTPASVLLDHLELAFEGFHGLVDADEMSHGEMERFIPYILSPRIHNELLTPWRSGLRGIFGDTQMDAFKRNPQLVVDWVRENIKIDDVANWLHVPMRPLGVAKLKVADQLGRDILFVALCRTAGIPARLEIGTLAPQFFQSNWKTVNWSGQPSAAVQTATIKITGHLETKPVYFSHFALARYSGGRYQTLDYEGMPWEFFEAGLALEPGSYCLTTGNRQDDGSVLIRMAYFGLKANESRVVPMVMRPSKPAPAPLGVIETNVSLPSIAKARFGSRWVEGRPQNLASLSNDKGLILAWIGNGDEPTRHALLDLEQLREPIEKWGGGLVLVVQELPNGDVTYLDKIGNMATQTQLLLDNNAQILKQILEKTARQPSDQLPVIMGVSRDGNVIYYSEGYKIGVGEQVLKAIRRMEK